MRGPCRQDRAGTAPPSTDKDNRSDNCRTKTDNVFLPTDRCGACRSSGSSSPLFPASRAQKLPAFVLDRIVATDITVPCPHILPDSSDAKIRAVPVAHARL